MLRILRRIKYRLIHLPRDIGYYHGPRLMSSLRKAWVLARHPHANISFGRHNYLGPGFSLHIEGPGTFMTGEGVEFRRDFRAEVAGDGVIEIGERTKFTYGSLIQCTRLVSIGSDCLIAQNCAIFDAGHNFRDPKRPVLEQGYEVGEILIANGVLIHSKVTIVANVGEHSVIGANAVVAKDIPAHSVAVGVPAKVVETFGDPRPT